MDIENRIKESRIRVVAAETDLQDVITNVKRSYVQRESERMLSYGEFVATQILMIRKRWWCLQMLLLLLTWQFLTYEYEGFYLRRGMGILAAMFVIIIVPELWKNLMNKCVEVEIASFYSLHRIYAARILIIGSVDVLLLTLFGCGAHYRLGITLTDIIINFLLPMTVTACICFAVLDRLNKNMGATLALSIIWCAAWWRIASNDRLYLAAAEPIWLAVFFLACMMLAWHIRHLLNNCDKCMEVRYSGTLL